MFQQIVQCPAEDGGGQHRLLYKASTPGSDRVRGYLHRSSDRNHRFCFQFQEILQSPLRRISRLLTLLQVTYRLAGLPTQMGPAANLLSRIGQAMIDEIPVCVEPTCKSFEKTWAPRLGWCICRRTGYSASSTVRHGHMEVLAVRFSGFSICVINHWYCCAATLFPPPPNGSACSSAACRAVVCLSSNRGDLCEPSATHKRRAAC